MASLKVAVRVRPTSKRELDMQTTSIISMNGQKTEIVNTKVPEHCLGDASRERIREFTYDHSYWSADQNDHAYASQEQIFKDLGVSVVEASYEGYNACVIAYGQTGSGKTYTMMGNPDDAGLIPRICQELFSRMHEPSTTYRTEVSYLEIYNEKVCDLLGNGGRVGRGRHSLRVREHPTAGPYVQDLSRHRVSDFQDIKLLMDRGNAARTTAATNMNDVSSRSHAIFTIMFTQAKFDVDAPSEMHSNVHLVDLAGSERADATGAANERLKEGGSINKSLVNLGNVISALADMAEKCTSCFIPYRNSVLTWLLKDSLGGNSKTIMIATISPSECNYAETLSTLRYANRAKNIVNKPTVNEDANVKLIKELQAEIRRLRMLLGANNGQTLMPKVEETLHESEARVKALTDEWTGKWSESEKILREDKNLALRREGMGVVIDSSLPHLIGIDDNICSTGVVLYHLKEGLTTVGTVESGQKPDIILSGAFVEPSHCVLEYGDAVVKLTPLDEALCTINGVIVTETTILSQASVIVFGKTNAFRFNHPAQAAKMRQEWSGMTPSSSFTSILSQSMMDLYRSSDNLLLSSTPGSEIEEGRKEQVELGDKSRLQETVPVEFVRLSEQHLQEAELEKARLQLTDMQLEAEQTRTQANEKSLGLELEELNKRKDQIKQQTREFLLLLRKFSNKVKKSELQISLDTEDTEMLECDEERFDEVFQEILGVLKETEDGSKWQLVEEGILRLAQELDRFRKQYGTPYAAISQRLQGMEKMSGENQEIFIASLEKEIEDLTTTRENVNHLRDEHLESKSNMTDQSRNEHLRMLICSSKSSSDEMYAEAKKKKVPTATLR